MTVPAAAVPESTYELLMSAARTWPDAIATEWIPDPADYARCQAWTYADQAAAVTRIANGLARLGIQREDAVQLCGPNSSALLAATLAAQAAGIAAPASPALGAAPLPPSVQDGFARHTGRRLLEGYGLTEATCASTWNRPGADRPGSVGQALPGQQVKAVRIEADGSWQDCAAGEAGVLVIGGPAVFAGYVSDPLDSGPRVSRGATVRDGWLDTGDLGHVDADGYVYLTGRAKDLIIRGGHNIDPRVIEEALLAHPGVTAAAAVGMPDAHAGEVPVAYVVSAGPAAFDEARLLEWAANTIGEPAARPKRIYAIPAIPLTAVGEQFKPALAADAARNAVAEAMDRAGVSAGEITVTPGEGGLAVSVAGADPGQVQSALDGLPLTVRAAS